MSIEMPKRTISHRIGSQGEVLVENAFADKGWVYRRLEKDKDYGIDGEVEIFDADGSATGIIFKVQIKSSRKHSPKIRLKRSTENYLSVCPLPVILISVEVSTGSIRFASVDQDQVAANGAGYSDFQELDDEAFDELEDIAAEHCAGCLSVRDYTLYNAPAQLIRCLDLLLNFGGDVDSMMKWLRFFAPDDVLASSYGYAAFLKEQMAVDKNLLLKLRAWVLEFFPGEQERIDQAMEAYARGELVGRRAEVYAVMQSPIFSNLS